MVLLWIGTEKILKCKEICTVGKEIISETKKVLDWGTAFVYILFWLIESRQGSRRLGSGSNSRGSLGRIGPSDFPLLPSTQKYIPPLSPSAVQKSGFLQTLWEGSNSKALAHFPASMNPMGRLTAGMPYYAPQILSVMPGSASSPHHRGFSLLWSLLPPWRNSCRPAKENGLMQFQKSPLVKVQTLWKSSWAKAISGSNRVTEAWLPIECSFTVD